MTGTPHSYTRSLHNKQIANLLPSTKIYGHSPAYGEVGKTLRQSLASIPGLAWLSFYRKLFFYIFIAQSATLHSMRVPCKHSIFFLICIMLTVSNGAGAQPAEVGTAEGIGVDDLLDKLINGAGSKVVYRNQTIRLDRVSREKIKRQFPNVRVNSGRLVINKSLELINCTITGSGLSGLALNNITFKNCRFRIIAINNVSGQTLTIKGGNMIGVRVIHSAFENISFKNLTNTRPETGLLSFYKTTVGQKLWLRNNSYFENVGALSCVLNKVLLEKNKAGNVEFGDNRVLKELLFENEVAREFTIRKNRFTSPDTLRYTFDLHCNKLVFIDNSINVPVLFADSRVTTRLEMADNTFNYPVDFHDMSFPEFDKYIPFRQFKQGFVVYENLYGEESPEGGTCFYCKLYTGESDEELADKTNFDKLVQSYEILFLGYKSTGDIESANRAYIMIKDLYLDRLGYLYRTHGGFKHYFRWQLARLLKFYTNHGTDPALSIVISIYVILIFAVFYIFFPSEWDITSKKRLIADFKEFIDSNNKGYLKPLLTLVVGLGISLINAITLSLNSFVTLGFGTIPTTGAARYVCILQGFIGWFLLSIFTVSLINQILF